MLFPTFRRLLTKSHALLCQVDAVLPDLPWHGTSVDVAEIGAPVFQLHPSVVAAMAPGIALRAAFGGARNI